MENFSAFCLFFIFCHICLSIHAQQDKERVAASNIRLKGVWYRVESSNVIESTFAKCIVHTYANSSENITKETISMQTLIGPKVVTNYYFQRGNSLISDEGHGFKIILDVRISRDKSFMCQRKTSTMPEYIENHLLCKNKKFKPRELERAKKEFGKICTEKLHPIDQINCSKN